MLDKVRKLIVSKNLIRANDRVLVGVSGGADSVCLLDILHTLSDELEFTLTAVHVNHMIRGLEADADEAYVSELCKEYGIEFNAFLVDVPDRAAKLGISTEEAGRIARYEIFDKIKADKIAVAHHMNDQAETVLHHIFRGSSIKGICGMEYQRDRIIRPLLTVTREEIEEYLATRNIKYCIDRTNLENDYTRNKLRNVLIPYVRENFNNDVVSGLCRLSEDARETYEFIHSIVLDAFAATCRRINQESLSISRALYKDYAPVIVRGVLMMAMQEVSGRQKDITRVHVESLKELMSGDVSRRISLPYKMNAISRYEDVLLEITEDKSPDGFNSFAKPRLYREVDLGSRRAEYSINQPDRPSEYSCTISLEVTDYKQNWENLSNDYTKLFDYDKIKGNVVIRNRMSGDYITVDSAGHRKLLKDYFINEKVPQEIRSDIPLVCDGSHVMWIIGMRMSAAYKIEESTKRVLIVKVKDQSNM